MARRNESQGRPEGELRGRKPRRTTVRKETEYRLRENPAMYRSGTLNNFVSAGAVSLVETVGEDGFVSRQ